MLRLWLMAFFLGTFLGKVGDAGARLPDILSMVLLLCFLLSLFGPARLAAAAAVVAGFFWGFGHSAPLGTVSVPAATVTAGSFPWGAPGVVVAQAAGKIFEVSGCAPVGTLGSVRCLPRPGLWAPQICRFHAEAAPALTESALLRLVQRLQLRIDAQLGHFTPEHHAWLAAVLIGDASRLDISTKQLFKDTGLFHLLVVSGLHVTLVAGFLSWLVRLPWLAAYALRGISPRAWVWVAVGLEFAVVGAALLYTCVTGMSVAAQRALVLFAVFRLVPVFAGDLSALRKLLLAGFFQSLLFPRGILSEASLMSWGAYLLCLGFTATGDRHWFRKSLGLHLKMAVICAACFGWFSFLGILLNPLFIPIFPLILVAGFVVAMLGDPSPWVCQVLLSLQDLYLQALGFLWEWLAVAFSRFGFSANLDLKPQPFLRLLLICVSSWFLLNTIRELSIKDREPDARPSRKRVP